MKKYDADKHGTSLLAAAWSLHRMLGRRQKACDENTDEKTEACDENTDKKTEGM